MKGNTVCVSKRGGGSHIHTADVHTENNEEIEEEDETKQKKHEREREAKKQKHGANASPSYIVEKSSVPVHSRRSST